MNAGRCIPDEALVGSAAWPADDPRWAHVAACARCRAVLLEHEAFLAEATEPDSIPDDVRAALDASIDRGLKLAAATAASARPPVPQLEPDRRSRWDTVRSYALAAGFIVIAGTAVLLRFRPGEQPLERGEQRPVAIQAFEPRTTGTHVEFRWHAWPGADAYRLELLGPDFAVVHRRSVGADTTCELPVHDETPALAGAMLYWRIVADSSGVRIAASEPGPIRLP